MANEEFVYVAGARGRISRSVWDDQCPSGEVDAPSARCLGCHLCMAAHPSSRLLHQAETYIGWILFEGIGVRIFQKILHVLPRLWETGITPYAQLVYFAKTLVKFFCQITTKFISELVIDIVTVLQSETLRGIPLSFPLLPPSSHLDIGFPLAPPGNCSIHNPFLQP